MSNGFGQFWKKACDVVIVTIKLECASLQGRVNLVFGLFLTGIVGFYFFKSEFIESIISALLKVSTQEPGWYNIIYLALLVFYFCFCISHLDDKKKNKNYKKQPRHS